MVLVSSVRAVCAERRDVHCLFPAKEGDRQLCVLR